MCICIFYKQDLLALTDPPIISSTTYCEDAYYHISNMDIKMMYIEILHIYRSANQLMEYKWSKKSLLTFVPMSPPPF